MIDLAVHKRGRGLGSGFQGIGGCQVGLHYVCVWNLVRIHFALEVGAIASSSDNSISFRGESLDELVLETISRFWPCYCTNQVVLKDSIMYTYANPSGRANNNGGRHFWDSEDER